MKRLNVEIESPGDGPRCKCCGKRSTLLTSYVFDDEGLFAQVLTIIDPEPSEPVASFIVGLAAPGVRGPAVTFAIRARKYTRGIGMQLVDDAGIGAISSKAALTHPRKQDAFDAIDAVLDADAVLMRHFERPRCDA
jgi:hypothetical protein